MKMQSTIANVLAWTVPANAEAPNSIATLIGKAREALSRPDSRMLEAPGYDSKSMENTALPYPADASSCLKFASLMLEP